MNFFFYEQPFYGGGFIPMQQSRDPRVDVQTRKTPTIQFYQWRLWKKNDYHTVFIKENCMTNKFSIEIFVLKQLS